jgi:hypothetical protein
MAGAMIPFAMLYIYGLGRILRWPPLVLPTIVGIVVIITISDFFANSVAFASAYNWFHIEMQDRQA